MRYLITVVHDGPIDRKSIPAEMYEAMGGFVSKLAEEGLLIDAAGLAPVEQATRINLRGGDVTVVDGPFAEVKEWIGGYFIVKAESEAEAIDYARRSVELHRKHAPGLEVTHEVRRIIDGGD
ncbi:MAG TPA: YciI family protein [Woeseiaceae bacterium]|jgi:hypothetical protein|nr:YciI family protein [Woeseiaceae bacterium]